MRTLAIILVLALFAPAGLASVVINFDDLVGQGVVPDGYGGVNDWGGWEYYDWAQDPYNPHSPPCRVYNYTDGFFAFGYDVVFEGAWFAGYDSVYFQLYNDNQLVHTSGSIGLSNVPTWLGAGYNGAVDQVQVVGSMGFFVMDDVQYVPEPATLGLLALAALVLRRR